MKTKDKKRYLKDFNSNINTFEGSEYMSRQNYDKLVNFYRNAGFRFITYKDFMNDGFGLNIIDL